MFRRGFISLQLEPSLAAQKILHRSGQTETLKAESGCINAPDFLSCG